MTDALERIKNEVAKENHPDGNGWETLTYLGRDHYWPEVSRRYALECCQATLVKVSDKPIFVLTNNLYPKGLRFKSYTDSEISISPDKDSILDKENIVIL